MLFIYLDEIKNIKQSKITDIEENCDFIPKLTFDEFIALRALINLPGLKYRFLRWFTFSFCLNRDFVCLTVFDCT